MINLKKSHLCETSLKILGHLWTSGGYCRDYRNPTPPFGRRQQGMDRGCHRFSKRSSNSHPEWSILDSLRPRQGITGRDQSHVSRDVRHHAPERSQQPEGMGTSSWVGQSPGLSGRKGPSPPTGTEGAAGRTKEASPACSTLPEANDPGITRSTGPVQTIP